MDLWKKIPDEDRRNSIRVTFRGRIEAVNNLLERLGCSWDVGSSRNLEIKDTSLRPHWHVPKVDLPRIVQCIRKESESVSLIRIWREQSLKDVTFRRKAHGENYHNCMSTAQEFRIRKASKD